jgi:hypothetical protein
MPLWLIFMADVRLGSLVMHDRAPRGSVMDPGLLSRRHLSRR